MKKIIFNGKFLTAASTGVHRVAEELIIALDRLIAADTRQAAIPAPVVLTPKTARRNLPLSRISIHKAGVASGFLKEILWEQFNLPWLGRRGRLVNLCNLGPVLHRNSITMIHDAQVYLTPESYSKGFRLWYRFIQPLLGKTNRTIMTVSEYSKMQLVAHGVARAEKISVIHNGCDHTLAITPDEAFVAASGLEKGRYVVALANTQAHKNIRVLLEAFAQEPLGDMTLVLFGSATREDFERKGQRVPGNVRFVGRISDAELAALFGDACALACPSLTEGFGLPPLEAMMLGCPAIIAPCGALPEVCGDAALVADPHEAGQWTDSIRRLADDPAFADEIRQRGRKQASAFTWEAAATRLLKLLEDTR